MILHIALAGLHLRRPSAREVRLIARYMAAGAGLPVAVLAAGAGLVWPLLVVAAAVAGSVAGSRTTGRRWQRRFATELDVNTRALGLQLAQYERAAVETFNREAAERNGRWLDLNDSRVQSGAGQPNKGYR